MDDDDDDFCVLLVEVAVLLSSRLYKTFFGILSCLNLCMLMQNGDGGFATYELTRSYPWMEVI